MSDPRPAPYPADTRAKGWRFELDYERIEQSDTWMLAGEVPMAQPGLLAMWYAAWKQTPCGSLPKDENAIRVNCKLPPAVWAKCREVLMRGWWLADDGRLYHDTMTERVREMLEYRRKNKDRVAKHKAAMKQSRAGNALPAGEQQGKNDTGTGTGTFDEDTEDYVPRRMAGAGAIPLAEGAPTPGDVCGALRRAGLSRVNPEHQTLRELLAAGATVAEFLGHAERAISKEDPFAYLLATVAGERKRAAQVGGEIHRGPLKVVNKQQAIEADNHRVADKWAAEPT